MIRIKNLSRSFAGKLVLKDVSFDIMPGSFNTLFGPNGCGKSTLVNIIAGIDREYSGYIEGLSELKNKVAYVFQDYRRSLLPWETAKENIIFPLKLRKVNSKLQIKQVEKIYDLAGIDLDLNQKVYSLSGGQAQAVCILRALIIEPQLLILDEPFAALDFERTLTLREKISKIAHQLNLATLFISHDLEEAVVLGDQVIFLTKIPTVVHKILKVNLVKPRLNNFVISEEFRLLKDEALKSFYSCL